ncbi:MAG: uracil-DNA glycosylase [Burkholderiales bacterium]|nr:uracil-DNA glycosylase [Burkholderiales bacterium]
MPNSRLVEPLASLIDRVPESWRSLIDPWRDSADGQRALAYIGARQAAGAAIYPAAVFRALELTPRDVVRVVILGQDPYHGPGQAEGLAFSVPVGVKPPPSLRNIFGELVRDLGQRPPSGHLGAWARQGVLLLNTALTVEDGQPGSHSCIGWEVLTDKIMAAVAGDAGERVFMLWGAHAQAKASLIGAAAGANRHLVLMANHPSPLSARRPPAPFVGCGHFGATNHFLAGPGRGGAIDWGERNLL